MGSQLLFHWVWNTISSRKERQFQASATRTLVCISVSFLFRVDGEVRHCVCVRVHACVSHFCWLILFPTSFHHSVLPFIGSTCCQCCLAADTYCYFSIDGGWRACWLNSQTVPSSATLALYHKCLFTYLFFKFRTKCIYQVISLWLLQ